MNTHIPGRPSEQGDDLGVVYLAPGAAFTRAEHVTDNFTAEFLILSVLVATNVDLIACGAFCSHAERLGCSAVLG